jgi:hypothetical protein
MFDLILDVLIGFRQLRDAHTERTFQAEIVSIVPLGWGYFANDFQALRAWLLSDCPSGKSHSPIEASRIILALEE